MTYSVENIGEDPSMKRDIELVERKGLGHPDSICDGIAESVSRKLCREYRDSFGKVLHHNTDEAQLVAGKSNPRIGGGETVKPIYILLTGRATKTHEGEDIPVERFAVEAAREYVDENFKELRPEHIEFETRIGETSTDLKKIFQDGKAPPANDTSFGVGHAPLSSLEKTVKEAERQVRNIREIGEDVKVMGLRKNGKIHLTLASAVISERIGSKEGYLDAIEKVERKTKEIAGKNLSKPVEVDVNTADVVEENSLYITETGTSAEMGDDGSVGRGNRVNGLITPNRSMSLEAASGKNPVTHVGKIYNLLADKASRRVYKEIGEFAQVKILSQIGKPIDKPQAVDIETTAGSEVEEIVREEIKNVEDVVEELIDGKFQTF